MPSGLVRSGDFRKGTPITLPHVFGNPVGTPENFGNVEPQSNTSLSENLVTWTPSASHFGNQVSFSLQAVPPVVNVAPGLAGTANVSLTNILGTNSATLSYFGAPAGVTLAFSPNPDTNTSIATITVAASVPRGRYTITVFGTETVSNIEYTYIHLVVSSGGFIPITQLATPVASPTGGSYTGAQSVTLAVDPHATATYYTTDGSTPTTGSTLYTGTITTVSSGTETIKAFSHGVGAYSDSAVMTDTYVITSAAPALVAHTAAASTGFPSSTTTSAINTTGATFILIAAQNDTSSGASNTITDSASNSWTRIPIVHFGSGGGGPAFYYCVSPTTSATHTFKNATTSFDTGLAVQAWKGLNAVPYAGSYSDSAAPPALALTPNIGDLVVFALGGQGTTIVVGVTVLPSGFVFTDDVDGVPFTENHIAMGYAVYDGTPATAVPVWSSAATYVQNQTVSDGAGNYYISGFNNNTNHALIGSGYWTAEAAGSYCQPIFSGYNGQQVTTASFSHA